MDRGAEQIVRESFYSALEMSRRILIECGMSSRDAEKTVAMFKERDERHLFDDYAHASDEAKLVESAKRHADELAGLFETDIDDPRKSAQ